MSTYGSLSASERLPNGVNSGSQVVASGGASRDLHGENPNMFDPAPIPAARQPVEVQEPRAQEMPGPAHPPYEQGLQQNLAQAAQRPVPLSLEHGRNVRTPSTPTSAVRVQEFFSAESRSSSVGQEQQGVRWMARFTEFLRTTASRGANGMDRMLDSFGIQHGGQGTVLRAQTRGEVQQINFSPPEELPGPPPPPPVPLSWSAAGERSDGLPLFNRVQVEQLRQAVREHPVIYGPGSEVESERSSRLQQEVQRQMDEYTSRHREHMLHLEQEVQRLRAERDAWRRPEPPVDPQSQGNLPQGPNVLRDDQGPLPVQDHLPQRHIVPHEDLPVIHRPGGQQQQSVPAGLGAPGCEQTGLGASNERPVDPQSRGNLPQGPPVYDAQGASDRPGPNKDRNAQSAGPMTDESQGVSSAQQWLGNPQAQDQMALLAGGMAQLQQAMLKQLSVTKDGDKSPEAVKPGVSQLPTLSSSIDIADWLEMLAAPMSDLSDGSASWWRQVCDQATKAYQAWTDAGPMERLTIAPPKDASLEDGRWGRVNSRAASMIVLALHENVRSEMVARRLTGSTVSLLFRLMTLYQPGGEAERSRILSNLQNPPEESEPQKAVEALRAWDRWLRRCRELSLATPDPTILSKGLTKMVRKIVEQNADMGFRTNLIKSTLQVDTRPTTSILWLSARRWRLHPRP